MNYFLDHHRDIIKLQYSCFDRMILSGQIQALQTPGSVSSFFWHKRQIGELTRKLFACISSDYHRWLTSLAEKSGIEIDRKSTRLNSSHSRASRMPSSA